MSTSYLLACKEVKMSVWVGQGFGGMETFYSGEPDTMEALGVFLNATRGKALVLTSHHEEWACRLKDFGELYKKWKANKPKKVKELETDGDYKQGKAAVYMGDSMIPEHVNWIPIKVFNTQEEADAMCKWMLAEPLCRKKYTAGPFVFGKN